MIDLTYIKNNNSNVQMYLNGGTWQTWVKPRNAKSVTFMLLVLLVVVEVVVMVH